MYELAGSDFFASVPEKEPSDKQKGNGAFAGIAALVWSPAMQMADIFLGLTTLPAQEHRFCCALFDWWLCDQGFPNLATPKKFKRCLRLDE